MRFVLLLAAICGFVDSSTWFTNPVEGQMRVPSSLGVDAAVLRPGDVVRLTVWPATEFSQDVSIDVNGDATFRRLGTIRVTSIAADSLRKIIIAGYTRYVRNPSIEVTFLRRVTVGGAVLKPGIYPVDATMTVPDILALAGGASASGDPHHIDLLREGALKPKRYGKPDWMSLGPLGSGDQISVPERSFVSRNSGIVAAMITAAATLVIAFRR